MINQTASKLTTVTLDDGRCLIVPDTDYPEVAKEIVTFIQQRLTAVSDELHEYLEQREEAAPTSVDRVRILDSVISYETRRLVRRWMT